MSVRMVLWIGGAISAPHFTAGEVLKLWSLEHYSVATGNIWRKMYFHM